MNVTELLNVTKTEDFDCLNDFIHDQWFDLDKVNFNKSESMLEIRFTKEMFENKEILKGSLIKKVKIPIVNCLLRIFQVNEYEILDTQEVGSYDMTWIEYNPSLKCLEISTGIPLIFKVFIRNIEIKIYKEDIPLDYKYERILGV